ncbi:HTH-type transcriptional regulator MalT [Micromonospora sp. MW-13]|uniref:BTAD domain-containing putative transcriptional regulator n=1 Tax=Micromonospora sp. MW-13 TaxID=2094022 RepID=UPI000ECF3E1B|nr:BTAD domain-containing putative transcriptional regulator [Micromonospora sp. MW-13]RGC65788.1 HTH-type transcriptional regulator MalT [Micromonospora sp. MW-13]
MPTEPARSPSLSLTRSRLITALDVRPRSLGLVVAPAGSGKTTLLAQYAATGPGSVGWLRVVPSDADPARALRRVEATLPDGGAGLLVVDDLHLVEGTPGESVLLDRALALVREGVRVLVGTRRMPPLILTRHEFSDSVVVDAEQLRFRTWEVERLLRDVYREPLPADDVAALARRLGGWAAGLKLYYLSTRSQPLADRRRAVASLGVRSALSRDYLTRTVLAELAPDLRRFLVHTCVFEVLTAQRCDRLLGGGDGQAALEELERRQAFTVSHDGGRSFAYHEVLRAHLIAALAEELGEHAARAWHARAGRLLAAEGAVLEAARCFARAQQWPDVHRLLDTAGGDVAVRGLDPWSDVLPAWFIAEDPWLVLADARHRINEGQLAAAVPLLRRAEEMFDGEPARARCRSLRADVTAWLPDGPHWRGHWSGWLRTATRRHPMVVVGEAERLTGAADPLVRAGALLLAGHAGEAARVLDRWTPSDAGMVGLACRLLRAAVALAGGDPQAPAAVAAVGLDADRSGLPWLARLARAVPALSGAEADLKEAAAVVEECDRLGDRWGALLAAGCAALARSLRGGPEPEEAGRLLDRAREVDSGVLAAWAQSLLALAAVRGRLPDADVEVRRAESTARAAGVPGARVLALAAGVPAGPGRAVGLSAVHAAAEHAGLPRPVVTAWVTPERGAAPAVPDTAPLTVRCFGGFRICLDGEPLNWSPLRPRARALARMLAMHAGRAVHRDRLLDALWPDTDPATATRTLHVALSSLRRFLDTHLPTGDGESLLHRDGDAYLLALPPGSWCDVTEFRLALERASSPGATRDPRALADLRVAVAAYTGELLPEDGPAEWVVAERETLRRQAADAAAQLAEAALRAAGADGAVATAARCVEIDPCHDAGWRLLIAAHDRAGNAAAAEHARRRYADVLVSLGLDPAPAETAPAGTTVSVDRRIPPPRSPRPDPTRARTSSGPPA